MNILALKHFSFDDSSAIAAWAERSGHHLEVRCPNELDSYPAPEAYDSLIILGGPMSVYQEETYPWLADEKTFVRQSIDNGKTVIGICLGAQMLAEVLGSRVYRNRHKEVGWHTVRRTAEQYAGFQDIPQEFTSFQWHGDTFDLPHGAVRLAYSEACGNQAFAYGDRVLALQFHLETSPSCMETMLTRWSNELIDAPYIQSADIIKAQAARSTDSFQLLGRILDRMHEQPRASSRSA